jgi:hypothetical protein
VRVYDVDLLQYFLNDADEHQTIILPRNKTFSFMHGMREGFKLRMKNFFFSFLPLIVCDVKNKINIEKKFELRKNTQSFLDSKFIVSSMTE